MATAPANDPAPTIVGQIILLRPEQIDATDRLRPIDPVWAEALAGIMEAEGGNHSPIQVCQLDGRSDYKLVKGGHRHRAAELKGMYLRAEVVSNDAIERRLREASDDMWRRDIAPLDRAAFIAELVTLHKLRSGADPVKDGRTVSAQVRWQKQLKDDAEDANVTMTIAYGWSDEVAKQLGLSKSAVERDLMLHRRLPAGLLAQLRCLPIGQNATQLRALAKLSDREQAEVVALLVAGEVKSVSEAMGLLLQKPKADPETKRLSAFIGNFQRMGQAERRGALQHLKPLLPAGLALRDVAHATAPDDKYRLELLAALDAARTVLAALREGEPVDDDQLKDAAVAVQMGILTANSGAVPMPGAA